MKTLQLTFKGKGIKQQAFVIEETNPLVSIVLYMVFKKSCRRTKFTLVFKI